MLTYAVFNFMINFVKYCLIYFQGDGQYRLDVDIRETGWRGFFIEVSIIITPLIIPIRFNPSFHSNIRYIVLFETFHT